MFGSPLAGCSMQQVANGGKLSLRLSRPLVLFYRRNNRAFFVRNDLESDLFWLDFIRRLIFSASVTGLLPPLRIEAVSVGDSKLRVKSGRFHKYLRSASQHLPKKILSCWLCRHTSEITRRYLLPLCSVQSQSHIDQSAHTLALQE